LKKSRVMSSLMLQSDLNSKNTMQFYCDVAPSSPGGLCRTPSTYGFGDSLELSPVKNELYVICKDGSVQSVNEPDRPIGWELHDTPNGWRFRISQMGFESQPCEVTYHSRVDPPPVGGRRVGSRVFAAYSREAAMYEQDDEDGEPEVTSNISFDNTRNIVDDIKNFAWLS